MDGETHSGYRIFISDVQSGIAKKRTSLAKRVGRAAVFGLIAALPLCGLVLLLEITQPAQPGGKVIAAELSTGTLDGAKACSREGRRGRVARLDGVSAELRNAAVSRPYAHALSASDAERAFASAPYASLKAGLQTEFVTREHRRVALRIVSRVAIVDRPIPDNSRLMDVVPASTANGVTFVWGPWLYTAEVEDKGPEPEVVVQKVL